MAERMEMPKHAFSAFFERIGDDGRLLPTHIGLVAALFYHHDCAGCWREFPFSPGWSTPTVYRQCPLQCPSFAVSLHRRMTAPYSSRTRRYHAHVPALVF